MIQQTLNDFDSTSGLASGYTLERKVKAISGKQKLQHLQ